MKKIIVDKHEGIAEVIDRILEAGESEIVVAIPKDSALGKSESNFRLLKREADLAEKQISIMSIDPAIAQLAEQNSIPLTESLAKTESSANDDTAVGPRMIDVVATEAVATHHRQKKAVAAEPEKSSFFSTDRFFQPRSAPEMPEVKSKKNYEKKPSRPILWWIIGVLVVLFGAAYVVTVVFGRAQVSIDFTKTPWNYQANVAADRSVSAIDPSSNVIPAQIFTTDKNITETFPATGQSGTVGVKSEGTITIYNNYSSAPQDLVATTRFLTPDGKLFRIAANVTVPGKPGSITAPIVADQAGPAYNVGPVAKLTIPGFQGGPKYDGFYGVIASGTTGGFTGKRPVPTAGDVADAKTKTTAILQADLESGLATSYPNNFKILDGATSVKIVKLTVSTSTDQNGNFRVFGEASLQAIGFDKAAFETYLLGLAQTAQPDSVFSSLNVAYGNVQANFGSGKVNFSVTADGTLQPKFSPGDFAQSVASKSINDARSSLAALPQLSDGTISVWPIWLTSLPSDSKKITVTVH